MKRISLVIIALLFTTATFAQQAATTSQDPTALGNAFFKALLDEDSKTLGNLISSDLDIISFDGQSVDGDLLVQGVGGGAVIIETGTVSDAVTRQYNSDSAVMTGTWKSKGNIQGQAFDNSVAFSVVSAKQGGTWKIVNVQFTPIRQ
ncbi:nuclear transport factor 2 family protein [Spirosoma pollinicola]|uniref:DUF4440 domain-containing protein n=1 Tax=Spirosoma pollinicola TaxID=2057025 RepID=A0A2K8YXX8_9BACT|nr:nuclear transport factor 2 family protein [Spirosoma pollinicola]AUD02398.1 DUF4440 domain-containing protein [Spirosoma pollinicola]